MLDETDKVVVVCPICRRHTAQRQGWLKTVAAWDCPFCGAALEIDHDRLATFLAGGNSEGAAFTARLSPRQARGITTRRSR
ncbi:MAG TPA: hypothetical protein VNF99_05355 [Stellaceae bacterium]|nr:hypothetical protein [Stellaceae bacterium]